MTSLILFRFHAEIGLCAERLRLLRTLNPDVPLYGMYGGPPSESITVGKTMGALVDGLYTVPSVDAHWKKMHQDLTLARWFRDVGHRVAFDVLYDIEYDLLLTEAVSHTFPGIDQSTVALSGLQRLEIVRPNWYWTSVGTFPRSIERYLAYMRTRFGLVKQQFVTQGPFPLLPRSFVEAIGGLDYPGEIFDDIVCEISFPGMAEALGFRIVDTGLHPAWIATVPATPACALFHCESRPKIRVPQIAAELAKPAGRRAFHPVKTFIDCESLLQLRGPRPASFMSQ